ncbi:MAG: hypothetical protein CMD83_17745 [Gammaproteobacteria bacterium]|nr:hypothetical protein [Gammaproteobacteria bacterium]
MTAAVAARNLAAVYGHALDKYLTYPSGVALLGRLRLAALEGNADDVAADVARVVEPIVSGESRLPDAAPCLATACFADELAEVTGDARLPTLLVESANRFEWDPDVRVEDFFFAGTLLGRAAKLTGDVAFADKLFDLLLSADTLQPNGLYWHCHASPFFWGRGNAFAALGIAEALSHVPEHRRRDELIERNVRHLTALMDLQHASGMWHQVIDDQSTYPEHSGTTMLGHAITRGLRQGWLPDSFAACAARAWDGVAERTSSEGDLEHVCVGTGPLETLAEYVDRPSTDGFDERGGAMALQFAVERMVAD